MLQSTQDWLQRVYLSLIAPRTILSYDNKHLFIEFSFLGSILYTMFGLLLPETAWEKYAYQNATDEKVELNDVKWLTCLRSHS